MRRLTSILSSLAVAGGLATGLVAGASTPAHADDRRCAGTIRAVFVDGDVVVPRGATCRLLGTRVDGNVKVYGGATLLARGVRVGGNVQAENHRRVEVTHRFVNGQLRRSFVDGSIQAKQGRGGEVRRTVVGSDIQVFSNRGRWEIYRNVVDGNLQCKSNDPRPVGARNRVHGNKEGQCRGF